MKFDFTTIMDRKGKDALAVDKIPYKDVQVQEGFSVLPMWVADMNFATVPSVQKVMTERIAHPAFAYFEPREEYFDAIIRWHAKRNGVQGLTRECIGYENGVLGGVLSALNVFCSRGDKVLVHAPTYIGNLREPHSCGNFLLPAQSVRQGVGALGDRACHGNL